MVSLHHISLLHINEEHHCSKKDNDLHVRQHQSIIDNHTMTSTGTSMILMILLASTMCQCVYGRLCNSPSAGQCQDDMRFAQRLQGMGLCQRVRGKCEMVETKNGPKCACVFSNVIF